MCKFVMAFILIITTAAQAQTGVIKGSVKFSGTKPNIENIRFAEMTCSKMHTEPVPREDVVINPNNTLKNVIVYIKSGLPKQNWPVSTETVTLDQKGCMYVPHVIALQVGQELKISNSDPTIHNINGQAKVNPKFNHAMLNNKVPPLVKKFEKPELPLRIKCDVHPWMLSLAGVFEHPFFAVSGADGSFQIKNVPPGKYTIEAWHEKYGTKQMTVGVAEGQEQTADFTFVDPVK